VLIRDTGEVIWIAPVTYKATCSVDVTWFPVDRQVCIYYFNCTNRLFVYTVFDSEKRLLRQKELFKLVIRSNCSKLKIVVSPLDILNVVF